MHVGIDKVSHGELLSVLASRKTVFMVYHRRLTLVNH